MLRTSDPKDVAILYLVTAFEVILAGGAMTLLIRAELVGRNWSFSRPSSTTSCFWSTAPGCWVPDRARAALAVVASLLRVGDAHALAEGVEQRDPGVDG